MWLLIQVFRSVLTEVRVQPELMQVTPTVRMAGVPDRRPGEVVVTDNWRVMHSRSGFTGRRHFEG